MLELLGMGIAGVAAIYGHTKSRQFTRRRLRFTSWVEKPALGLAAGVAAAVVAAPIVAFVPFVPHLGTALLFGAGVGTGVSMGAKDAKEGSIFDDD
jgi:hypothetical protein